MSDPFIRAHRARPSVYNLAGRVPVSIRDQLVRAQILVERLLKSSDLSAGSKLLVVGAGAAGATVGILAARNDIDVVVVDAGVGPFALQKSCTTRWIDPVQYDWPAQHADRGRWPLSGPPPDVPMKFEAEFANVIAENWSDVLSDETFMRPNLDVRFETTLKLYPVRAPSSRARPLTAEFSHPVHGVYTEDFDVVVLARGVARERVSVPFDEDDPKAGVFSSVKFWQTDQFQSPTLGLTAPDHRVLVSGGGDGALQDYIRLTTGTKSALQLLTTIISAVPSGPRLLELLRWELAEAEDQAHRMQLWSADGADDHAALQKLHDTHVALIKELQRSFVADWRAVMSAVCNQANGRNPERILLVHPCTHFSMAYGLNRFLALLIRECIREGFGVDTVSGMTRVRSVRPNLGAGHSGPCPAGCWGRPHFVELLHGAGCLSAGTKHPSGFDYQGVVIRHGTEQHTRAGVRRHSLPRHL